MAKLIVIGASGSLGSALTWNLSRKGLDVLALSRAGKNEKHFDIAYPNEYDYSGVERGCLVVITAAISSPDICQADPAAAVRINVEKTSETIDRFLERDARVLFFSSDAVFGNVETPVFEDGVLNPTGWYGETKAEVERRYRMIKGFIPLRLSYVISKEDKFTQYLSKCAKSGETASVFAGLSRRVILSKDVESVVEVLNVRDTWDDVVGINMAGPALLSRPDVAKNFAEVVPSLKYIVEEPPSGFYEARPKTINMHSRYLEKILGRRPTDVLEGYRAIMARTGE